MLLTLAILLICLTLTLLGLAGVVASWLMPWKILACLRVAFLVLLAVGLLATVSCLVCEVGDGRYGQAEFQLTFLDPSGNPIEGVELRVEDQQGRTYFHYPVDDYVPLQIPTSDRNGLMVFHHVSRGFEFSERTYNLFFVIRIRETPAPAFFCCFLQDGEEVYRIPFRDLDWWEETWEHVTKVKRRWQSPAWPEVLVHPGESAESWHDRIVALFDRNGNGRLDPEEAAAYYSATRHAEESQLAQLPALAKDEETEFAVVRRTISVQGKKNGTEE